MGGSLPPDRRGDGRAEPDRDDLRRHDTPRDDPRRYGRRGPSGGPAVRRARRAAPLAQRALDATRSGRTRILPDRFEKTWEHWLTNIRDWNVSRQLWWGHRIPAWYCPNGHTTVSEDPAGPSACAECGSSNLTQD